MFRDVRQDRLGDGLCIHGRITMHAFTNALQKSVLTPERTVLGQSPAFVIQSAKQDREEISKIRRLMRGEAVT